MPPDLTWAKMLHLKAGEFGEGFSPKLSLDQLAPADQTLFIDADCLCTRNVGFVFDRCAGRPVTVVGGEIREGEWFGNVKDVCRRFGVEALPKFNGGIYYLERGEMASRVYARARELETEYDSLGLVRLRGRPNDELLLAIAMAVHGLTAVPDDGTILSSPFECPGDLSIDVIRRRASLTNPPPPDPRHRDWYPFHRVQPAVVHFLGDFHCGWQYRREAMRVLFAARGLVGKWIGRILSVLVVEWPGRLQCFLKNGLRPLYHRFFGTREVKRSERL